MWNGKLAMTASLIVLRWCPGFEMFKKNVGVSKNTTDNQSLPSVILIYTIHILLFKFHLYNCNYKWNTAWPSYRSVHQKILTLPLFMKLFALYTINLKGRKFSYVQLFFSSRCKLFDGLFSCERCLCWTLMCKGCMWQWIFILRLF